MHVRKAVILAAGYGTRFLPATKVQPKEMLPLIDKPIIQYLVEEAVASGIKDIIKPLEFKPGQLFIDDELLSTIVLVNPTPTLGAEENSITVTYVKLTFVISIVAKISIDFPIYNIW